MENILIVDDHPVVLDGLCLLLRDVMLQGNFFTATDGRSALDMVEELKVVDWIFLDVKLPDIDGIKILSELLSRRVTANVVTLSSENSPEIIDQALKHNASGFLSKSFDRAELQRCLETIERGQVYLAPEQQRELRNYRESVLSEQQHIEESISVRQRQTLLLLAEGYSNKEIASSLEVTESTVKSHVQALMALFGADNRTHCASEARRLNIV